MKLFTDNIKVVQADSKAQAFDRIQEIYADTKSEPEIGEIQEIPPALVKTWLEAGATRSQMDIALESHASYSGKPVMKVVGDIEHILKGLTDDDDK